ncbi:MAG: DUF1080 domain-containing protein [Phycisphaeraceae bacterium]|nr:DUF1080 domain-containing protein [Phycisphaeraceae bacterium]
MSAPAQPVSPARVLSACIAAAALGVTLVSSGCAGRQSPVAAEAHDTFIALFNGENLDGWQGLAADPVRKAAMTPAERAKAQRAADAKMHAHWRVENGEIYFDGKGDNLCTVAEYADFELFIDWKIPAGGDSGIYLRGTPQVQIWDNPIGSGGLYNNQKTPSGPLVVADRPVGTWNTFHIRMIGERVSVWLNGKPVVDDLPLENYWARGEPLPARGTIELQAHGGPLWFRNILLRPLNQTP